MEKAYLFLRKLVTLGLNVLIFLVIGNYIQWYYSIPILLIIFSFIVSRITNTAPKELYNFQRSEKFFALGGLRDLLRIPVLLFAFLHDMLVWIIWGVYQILLLVTELIYFIKEIIFWLLHAILWFLKQFLPFWHIVFRLFIFYGIKWPWWIYRYSFKSIKKAYNWNILKVSLIGAFIALFIFHLFYFLEISLEIYRLQYIGLVLALLPISWVFGEIASIRGQKLMYVPYSELRGKLRNGIETVRGLLFFITFFVVLLLAQAGLGLLGWIPRVGVTLLGFSLNISFVLNIVLMLLVLLIFFGSFVLPTYRLYNEFNETSFKNIYRLLHHILKRSLQYVIGFIPSTLFAGITIIPVSVLVGIAFVLTMQVKESITQVKIDKLLIEQSNAKDQLTDYRLGKETDRMEYIASFPKQFFQDINHKSLLKEELNQYKKTIERDRLDLLAVQAQTNENSAKIKESIESEQGKLAINQTRVDELQQKLKLTEKQYKEYETNMNMEIAMLEIDIEYANREFKQLPLLLYSSGLFVVVMLSLVLAFALAYYGNFFYRSFLYRNNATPAKWRELIQLERTENHNQPLLSTTLNIVLITAIVLILLESKLINSIF
jgi:hypothetical protein